MTHAFGMKMCHGMSRSGSSVKGSLLTLRERLRQWACEKGWFDSAI